MRIVSNCLVAAALLASSQAMAVDVRKPPVPQSLRSVPPASASCEFACDNGVEATAYYQERDSRYGNLFHFGTGAYLLGMSFTHYGYGFRGPYAYNLEVWDPATCTKVAGWNNLVAADAELAPVRERVDLYGVGVVLTGEMVVAIAPRTCLLPNDCYPDLMFDDQLGVRCPVVITSASSAPVCVDPSPYGGAFLLRVWTFSCHTPVQGSSWGQLKSVYR